MKVGSGLVQGRRAEAALATQAVEIAMDEAGSPSRCCCS